MRFIFKGYLLRWAFLLLLARYRSLALMLQILKKVFRHKFLENGDRPLFRRLFFWNKKGRVPILLVNGKERATGPSVKKGDRPLFYLVLPLVYRLLDLTKIRG